MKGSSLREIVGGASGSFDSNKRHRFHTMSMFPPPAGRLNADGEGASMGAYRSAAKRNGSRTTSANLEITKPAVSNGAAKCNGVAPGALIAIVQDCRLRKVLQKIASDSPQKIQDLALECNLSESHLQHLFKESTGLGLGRLLIEKRMQRAVELLGQTTLSIKEIAWSVGYEHTSSFTRAFERHFHEGPRCFRQRQQRQNGNGTKEQL
jgi:AraC-like DNA-binding protein